MEPKSHQEITNFLLTNCFKEIKAIVLLNDAFDSVCVLGRDYGMDVGYPISELSAKITKKLGKFMGLPDPDESVEELMFKIIDSSTVVNRVYESMKKKVGKVSVGSSPSKEVNRVNETKVVTMNGIGE